MDIPIEKKRFDTRKIAMIAAAALLLLLSLFLIL